MRWAGRRVAVYAHGAPTDMRKGCGLVTERLGRDPLSGGVFLFVSRDRIRAKVLHFDGTGLCLYVKRLERARFAALWGCTTDSCSRSPAVTCWGMSKPHDSSQLSDAELEAELARHRAEITKDADSYAVEVTLEAGGTGGWLRGWTPVLTPGSANAPRW